MIGVLSFLIGSKVGRYALIVGIAVISIGLAVLHVFKKGQDHERQKQLQQKLKNLQTAVATDREIRSMAPSDRDERIRKWLRHGDE